MCSCTECAKVILAMMALRDARAVIFGMNAMQLDRPLKNGKSRGPGGWSVDGPLFWFLCSSQICVPPYSFLKEGFWGAYLSFSLR